MPRIALSYAASEMRFSFDGNKTVVIPITEAMDFTSVLLGDGFVGTIKNVRFDSTAYDASDVSRLSNGVEPDLAINDLAANALGDQLATDAAQNTLNA